MHRRAVACGKPSRLQYSNYNAACFDLLSFLAKLINGQLIGERLKNQLIHNSELWTDVFVLHLKVITAIMAKQRARYNYVHALTFKLQYIVTEGIPSCSHFVGGGRGLQ